MTLRAYRIWVPLDVRIPSVRANFVTAYILMSGPKIGIPNLARSTASRPLAVCAQYQRVPPTRRARAALTTRLLVMSWLAPSRIRVASGSLTWNLA
jgi:hypothetical protein